MAYRLEKGRHSERPPGEWRDYPRSNVQKLTTRNDIYWDGETTFEIAFPCFYVEARDYHPHTYDQHLRRDFKGWPGPYWPDGSDQKEVNWRELETMHARQLGEYHDGIQMMPTPFGLACTGRRDVCHDYVPRRYHRVDRICVNCIHKAIPIQLWDEYYRIGQMRIYAIPADRPRDIDPELWFLKQDTPARFLLEMNDVTIGEKDFSGRKTKMQKQHIVRVWLREIISERDITNMELWYDLKIRAPWVWYVPGAANPDGTRQKGIWSEGGYGDTSGAPPTATVIWRPRTDTVAKGRIHIDPSVTNRVKWPQMETEGV